MSAPLQSQAESDTIIAFCLCVARASVSLKRLCWNKNLNCISNKSHLWLAIILTYTIRLQKFLAEVLQRKQEIRRCFVFPPHVSSASALPCEIENREDGALVHCACNTLSNFCSALDFVYSEPCFQQPRAERIDYKIYGVIQQLEYESWVKKIEEIKQLVEFSKCTNTAFEWKMQSSCLPVLPGNAEGYVIWVGIQ